MRRPFSAGLAVALMLGGAAIPAAAQAPSSWFKDTVTVVPGKRYQRDAIFRLFFGSHYRNLWTTPIRVPVLDLATFAGGLKPEKEGGGQQTKSLRLIGANGKEYQFRSLDKDPSKALPLGLRETFADRLFQDQISAAHPAGPLIVPPILAAAGVLHAEPVMVVMPDDPALGGFQKEYAGLLGLIEERPRDGSKGEEGGFAGAKEIVGTDDLIKKLDKHPEVRLDSKAFLLARLTDVFLGDWDRHRDQWRWALLDDQAGERWYPIPRDRDQAFVKFDGLVLGAVRGRVPQLVKFGPGYPSIEGATWNGRDLDHRFLSDIGRPAWDSVAAVLKSRITDAVIDQAVAQLPAEFKSKNAAELRRALIARRDGLTRMATKYYNKLATQVDIYGSEHADMARVTRSDSGVRVVVSRREHPDRPFFERLFKPGETSDIRIYLQAGADSTDFEGQGSGHITVRAIGAAGNDGYVENSGGPTKLYDAQGENHAANASINTKRYQAIDDTTDKTALPHRDWGRNTFTYPVVGARADAGFQLGFGSRIYHWGFRKKPYASQVHYTIRGATGNGIGKITFDTRFQSENSRNFWEASAHLSGIESIQWNGFGDDRERDPSLPKSHYYVAEREFRLDPSLGWAFGEKSVLTVGPRFRYTSVDLTSGPNIGRFISLDRPYGIGDFAQVGLGADLRIDTRKSEAPRSGINFTAGARFVPGVLDIEKSFGEIHGKVATYLSADLPTKPVLALMLGGKKVFGTAGKIPFYEAAFLGGSEVVRGFQTNRFAGDGAVFGSAELRLHLTNLFIFVPGQQGVFGFVDAGRVYLQGENSDSWHHGVGGGVWFALLTPDTILSLSTGKTDDGWLVYLKVGFAY